MDARRAFIEDTIGNGSLNCNHSFLRTSCSTHNSRISSVLVGCSSGEQNANKETGVRVVKNRRTCLSSFCLAFLMLSMIPLPGRPSASHQLPQVCCLACHFSWRQARIAATRQRYRQNRRPRLQRSMSLATLTGIIALRDVVAWHVAGICPDARASKKWPGTSAFHMFADNWFQLW